MRRFLGLAEFSSLPSFACFLLIFTTFLCCQAQAQQFPPGVNTAATFLSEVALKYPAAAALNSMSFNAEAQWTLGSQKETGTATAQASSDGSTSFQLNLDGASRAETRSALGDSRSCQWADTKSAHTLQTVDCSTPVPWFAPLFAFQPSAVVLQLLNISDDGAVTRSSETYRQISYLTAIQGTSTATTNLLTSGTKVSVLYDPQTLLPTSIEYLQHADNDLNTTIPVRIVYSNYQTVSGTPVPYQIDRYVNGVLQLALSVTSASLK